MTATYDKQNDLLLTNLKKYYSENDFRNLDKIIHILNGESPISLRIVDWFVTNFSKQKYVVNTLTHGKRFKVYDDYKLKLKAYSKKRFDPFCRWDKIIIPYRTKFIQTTIGQLNFFKWVIDNEIIEYIEQNHKIIEEDMNLRNSTTKPKTEKCRKKREELSISASKSIKKEMVEISLTFN